MKLAAAVLSAYMAMTGMNADLPQLPQQTGKSTTIEESITSNAVAPNATTARRRPVRHPAPPSHVMIDVAADEDVRYTNHEAVPVSVRTCIERSSTCANDLLAPGQSTTRNDLVRSLGRENATLEVYTTSNITGRAATLEVRARNDAIPTTQMTTERMNMPVMGANQTFSVYTSTPFTLKRLMSNGVEIDSRDVTPSGSTTTLTPFTNLALGEQIDIIPSGKAVMTSTLNGVQYRAKALSEAVGVQTITKVDNSTLVWVKNIDPTAILSVSSNHLPQNTDNSNAGNYQYASAVNWGTTVLREMVGTRPVGGVEITGLWANNTNTPYNAWSSALVQKDGANANNSFGENGKAKFNISLNQLPQSVTLANASSPWGAVNGTLTFYNDAGTKTGTAAYSIPSRSSIDVDLSTYKAAGATRLEASVNNGTESTTPNVLAGATIDGVVKGGYQVAKPAAVVEPQYDITTKIYVRDNGKTFIQTTSPSASTVKKIFGFEPINTLDPLVGLHQYACESLPDPIVNSVPEIVRNYLTLTPAEQKEFSGDVEGWKPFIYTSWPSTNTIDPCNSADPDGKFTYMITTEITRK